MVILPGISGDLPPIDGQNQMTHVRVILMLLTETWGPWGPTNYWCNSSVIRTKKHKTKLINYIVGCHLWDQKILRIYYLKGHKKWWWYWWYQPIKGFAQQTYGHMVWGNLGVVFEGIIIQGLWLHLGLSYINLYISIHHLYQFIV